MAIMSTKALKKSKSEGKKTTAGRKRPMDESEDEQQIASPPLKKGSASITPCSVNEAFKTKINGKGDIFVDHSSIASYIEDDVWAILEDIGFHYNNSSGFGHPDIAAVAKKKNHNLSLEDFVHEDGLRKYLCRCGIPDIGELEDKHDAEIIRKWVAFANVPIKESEMQKVLESVPIPSNEQALEFLMKLGFQKEEDSGNLIRPSADGVDYFRSIEEARCFVRSADDTVLLVTPDDSHGTTPRKRSRRSKASDFPLSDEQLLALRLWAAVSPSPLPSFNEDQDGQKRDIDVASDGEPELPADSRTAPSTCIIL